MKDILKRIDGNKTILALASLAFIQKFGIELGMTQLWYDIAIYTLTAISTGTFAHHVQKGSFLPNKN